MMPLHVPAVMGFMGMGYAFNLVYEWHCRRRNAKLLKMLTDYYDEQTEIVIGEWKDLCGKN
jgi:hypothetical protein